jgi:hypothetical protein
LLGFFKKSQQFLFPNKKANGDLLKWILIYYWTYIKILLILKILIIKIYEYDKKELNLNIVKRPRFCGNGSY